MPRRRTTDQQGYAMVALLVGISIMSIALSVALPAWSTLAKREREEELIFRGQQYARAIALYQRQFANAFPPSIDALVEQRFLRKRFKDPMTADGEFQPILVGDPIPGQTTPPQVGQQGAGAAGRALGEIGSRTGGLPSPNGSPAQGRGGGVTVFGRGQAQARGGGVFIGQRTGAGIVGVVSRSTDTSLRLYNGRNKYNEWAFVAQEATTRAGAPGGGQAPGTTDVGRGRRGGRFGLPQPLVPQPGRRGRQGGNQ